MTKPQKNAVGDQIALLQIPEERGREQGTAAKDIIQAKIQKPQDRRPNTLNLNMIKAKQQWKAEMERLNSKYNLDYFFRFRVRLRIR